jgi:hypothetical protein
MKKINFETLVERLSQELVSCHNYSVIHPEDGMVIFQSPDNSEFGDHTVLFNVFTCVCDGIPFYIGQPRNLPNERIKILIHKFISTVLDGLLVTESQEGTDGL